MMKFSMKYGFCLLAGIFLCATVQAESVPIEDRDAFEKRYIECVMSGLKDNCLFNLLSNHLTPATQEDDKQILDILRSFGDFYKDKPPVYKVHIVDKIMRAGIVESRTYMIERSDGVFVGSYINFVKIKDGWYINAFGISGADEVLEKILQLPVYR
jgi:hypothetical protein